MLDIKYSLYNLYLYRIDRIINNQFILFFKFIAQDVFQRFVRNLLNKDLLIMYT